MPTPTAPAAPAANPMAKAGVVGLVALALGFVVGYGMGRVSTGTPVNPVTGIQTVKGGSYEEGYAAAQKKLADSGLFPAPPTETRTLSGTVKSTSQSSFTLEADSLSANPLEETVGPKERTVTLAPDAKIYRQVPKSPEDQQKEFDAFVKASQSMKPGDILPNPPTPYLQQAIAIADLKPGDRVSVTASENILTSASIVATEVTLSAAVTSPVPPPAP